MPYVAGVTVRVVKKSPLLRVAIIDIDQPSVVARTFDHHSSKHDSHENQLHTLGTALGTQFQAHEIVAVAIREAGYAPRSSANQDSVKARLRAEGIALAQGRLLTGKVIVGDVTALARLRDEKPADLDAAALALAGEVWKEPVSAALAALHLN